MSLLSYTTTVEDEHEESGESPFSCSVDSTEEPHADITNASKRVINSKEISFGRWRNAGWPSIVYIKGPTRVSLVAREGAFGPLRVCVFAPYIVQTRDMDERERERERERDARLYKYIHKTFIRD
jgi:hypothetical protein